MRGIYLRNQGNHLRPFGRQTIQTGNKNDLKAECEKELGTILRDINISFVRNVAPKKDMFRITIPLDLDILSGSNKLRNNNHSESKRQKLDL